MHRCHKIDQQISDQVHQAVPRGARNDKPCTGLGEIYQFNLLVSLTTTTWSHDFSSSIHDQCVYLITSVYNDWMDCLKDCLRESCDEEAAGVMEDYLDRFTAKFLHMACSAPRFAAGSEYCRPLLPPPNSTLIPDGYGSSSILSHLFSFYCRSVGY